MHWYIYSLTKHSHGVVEPLSKLMYCTRRMLYDDIREYQLIRFCSCSEFMSVLPWRRHVYSVCLLVLSMLTVSITSRTFILSLSKAWSPDTDHCGRSLNKMRRWLKCIFICTTRGHNLKLLHTFRSHAIFYFKLFVIV